MVTCILALSQSYIWSYGHLAYALSFWIILSHCPLGLPQTSTSGNTLAPFHPLLFFSHMPANIFLHACLLVPLLPSPPA